MSQYLKNGPSVTGSSDVVMENGRTMFQSYRTNRKSGKRNDYFAT